MTVASHRECPEMMSRFLAKSHPLTKQCTLNSGPLARAQPLVQKASVQSPHGAGLVFKNSPEITCHIVYMPRPPG